MSDISSLAKISTGVGAAGSLLTGVSALKGLLFASPQSVVGYQPQSLNGAQLPTLVFHYEGEQTAALESDITDHYVEDNTAIQDQIALRPVIITTQGFIGELNDVPPNKYFAAAQIAAQKLTAVSGYVPSLSATAILAYNEALFAYSAVSSLADSAVSAFSSITGVSSVFGVNLPTNQTQQQKYFTQLYGYWNSRTLFTIQTPWALFPDMAIKSLRAIQSAETNVITDFEIQFKQMRFATANTTTLYSDTNDFQGRLQNQAASVTPLGTSALTASSTTFASTLA